LLLPVNFILLNGLSFSAAFPTYQWLGHTHSTCHFDLFLAACANQDVVNCIAPVRNDQTSPCQNRPNRKLKKRLTSPRESSRAVEHSSNSCLARPANQSTIPLQSLKCLASSSRMNASPATDAQTSPLVRTLRPGLKRDGIAFYPQRHVHAAARVDSARFRLSPTWSRGTNLRPGRDLSIVSRVTRTCLTLMRSLSLSPFFLHNLAWAENVRI